MLKGLKQEKHERFQSHYFGHRKEYIREKRTEILMGRVIKLWKSTKKAALGADKNEKEGREKDKNLEIA